MIVVLSYSLFVYFFILCSFWSLLSRFTFLQCVQQFIHFPVSYFLHFASFLFSYYLVCSILHHFSLLQIKEFHVTYWLICKKKRASHPSNTLFTPHTSSQLIRNLVLVPQISKKPYKYSVFTGDEASIKRTKKANGTETVDSSTTPNNNPTPLEVLSRFTIAKDEELPKLVWNLIDEVQYRRTYIRAKFMLLHVLLILQTIIPIFFVSEC